MRMVRFQSPLTFLLEASEILGSSFEYESTLGELANLVAREFADWCTIYLLDNAGLLQLIAVAHRDPAKAAWARGFLAEFPPSPHTRGGVYSVIESRRPLIYSEVRQEHIEHFALNSEHRRHLDAIGFSSAMIVPIVVREKGVGAMHFAAVRESGKMFGTSDLVVAEELARRVAMAIDNATLYRQAQQATARLRALIHASPLPVVSMDLEGRVNDWNPAAERVTGWKREEVLGNFNPMLPSQREGRDDELFTRLRRGETIEGAVVRRKRRDGTLIYLRKWASPLEGEDGTIHGFLAIYNDVTDRLRFLQVASHELGNPLTSIRALQSLMRMHIRQGAPPEKPLSDLDRLQAEIDRFTNLFREIVDTFQAHQGRLSYQPTLLEVQTLVKERAARWAGICHPIVFKGGEEPAWVEGDPRRLEQVLDNLLSNAAKYSPKGSPILISVAVGESSVVISVTDQGIGIPEAEIPRIFDEFYRVEHTSSDLAVDGTEGGIGLGLSICREIVLQHKGRIWVESELHKGSTFYVELPLAAGTRGESPAAAGET